MEKTLIGAYIKQQREDRGWTQDFLCEGICSRTTLSRIENDTQAPSFAVLKKLFEKMCLPSKQFLMLTSKDNIVAENLQKKIKNNGVLFQEVEGDERSRIQAQILKDLDKLESLCGEDDPFIRQFILSAQVTTGRLERRHGVRRLRIHHRKDRPAHIVIVSALYHSLILRNDAAVAHFTSGCGDRKHDSDRKTRVCLSRMFVKIPHIARIGHSITNRFCRVDDAPAANCENKIHLLFFTKIDPLIDKRQPRIWNNAAKHDIRNSFLIQRFLYPL